MMLKITWKRALLSLLALVVLGVGVAGGGLVPIAASTGHWKITDWFLHWTMQNSARTYSAFQTPEKVRDDSGLVSAAGHFRQACQVCHGAPGIRPAPVVQAASPPAPDLAKTAGHYSDRELFWIIQHGVKYTGMPAWPDQDRPDEVSRMVGFVRRLPSMTPAQYRDLTEASVPSRNASLARCMGCHGVDGRGRSQPDIPVLAGQKAGYLLHSLRRHASGAGDSAVMHAAAFDLDERQMRQAADYFAALPGLHDAPLPDTHPMLSQGLPGHQVPACRTCHAPGKPAPILSGQRAPYLSGRLRRWHGDETVVDARKPRDPMAVIARRIPESDIQELVGALSHDAAIKD